MKNIVYCSLFFNLSVVLFLPACKKKDADNADPVATAALIAGRWKVVNDSLANMGNYYTNSGIPNAGNYIGVAADYLEFRANGEFYYQESFYSGSSTYQLFPNNKIAIYYFQPGMHQASIKNLTANSMTLYGSDTSANGGIVIKIINLKK